MYIYAVIYKSQLVKNPPAMWDTWARSWVSKIPWRREQLSTPALLPGEFHGLHSMDCIIHGVAKSQTQLSDFHIIYIDLRITKPTINTNTQKRKGTPKQI